MHVANGQYCFSLPYPTTFYSTIVRAQQLFPHNATSHVAGNRTMLIPTDVIKRYQNIGDGLQTPRVRGTRSWSVTLLVYLVRFQVHVRKLRGGSRQQVEHTAYQHPYIYRFVERTCTRSSSNLVSPLSVTIYNL